MDEATGIDFARLAQDLQIKRKQVENVVRLLDEGNTVPFIARFRKEETGDLDDIQIRSVQHRLRQMRQLFERREIVLRTIESQGKLTEELKAAIAAANTPKRLEDLYLPYKPKKQTLATIARQRGLEPLAEAIWNRDPMVANLDEILAGMIDPQKQLNGVDDVLVGVQHILAEKIAETADVREAARRVFWNGRLVASRSNTPPETTDPEETPKSESHETPASSADEAVAEPSAKALESAPPEGTPEAATPEGTPESAPAEAENNTAEPAATVDIKSVGRSAKPLKKHDAEEEFRNYFNYSEPVRQVPPHRLMAINRGEKQGTLKVRVEVDRQRLEQAVFEKLPLADHPQGDFIGHCAIDSLDRLLTRSLEREVRSELNDFAEHHAVGVFAQNLSNLLLQPPVSGRRVLAIDPGYRTGCKYAVMDEIGNVLDHGVIFPHLKRKKKKRKKGEIDAAPGESAPAKEAPAGALSEPVTVSAEAPAASSEPGPILPADSFYRTTGPGDEQAGGSGESIESTIDYNPVAETEAPTPVAKATEVSEPTVTVSDSPVLVSELSSSAAPEPTASPEASTSSETPPAEGSEPAAMEAPAAEGESAERTRTKKPRGAPPMSRRDRAKKTIDDLCKRYDIGVIAIGNGAACRETEELASELIAEGRSAVPYVIVNEAGASVYSTSPVGREEFPDFDATLRGTISIGRRLQDPLSELVKIDPQNIGVGMYQHDVNPRVLKETLSEVVESCVNYVGVDLNTASAPLLQYVSGLNQLRARNLVEYRKANGPFKNREQLKDVPGVGPAVFTQAAGFLKILGGDQPFDTTWIHPESYATVKSLLDLVGASPEVLNDRPALEQLRATLAALNEEETAAKLNVSVMTVRDIVKNLARPGRDPREDLPTPIFKTGILKLEDLTEGMLLRATVLNVVDFGVFVDIGLKDSGLVHISQIANRYVRSPHDIVAVGDVVTTWVLHVDRERRRVSLTMISPEEQRQQKQQRRPRRPQGQLGPGEGRPAEQGAVQDMGQQQTGRPPRGGEVDRRQGGGGHGQDRAQQQGQQGRGRRPPHQQQKRPPRRPTNSSRYETRRPTPQVKLSAEALEGKEVLHTFGELKALFEAKKKPSKRGDEPEEKPAEPQQ